MLLAKFILLVSLFAYSASAANILAVFPVQSPSHYILVKPLLLSLAERGHKITALSPYPNKTPINNFRDIQVPKNFKDVFVEKTTDNDGAHSMSPWELLILAKNLGVSLSKAVLEQQEVQQLLHNRNETFDLVITETCTDDGLFGFAAHFDAPVIGVAPFGAHTWSTDLTGAPTLPSFIPHFMLPYSSEMSFWQRVHNFIFYFLDYFVWNWQYLPQLEPIFAKHFGHTGRTMAEVRRNFSLVLVNQHFSLGSSRPYTPNMIDVGGMQITNKTKPLPKHVEAFLDGATEGAIYFSLGSNIKSSNMDLDKFNAFLNTFRSLPQRVLWKLESENMSNLPANVLVNAWFPQSDLLAHPNIKLFITHGGLLSVTEALARGKPMLGIPFFGDQPMNIERAQQVGYGLGLDYKDVTEEKFSQKVRELLSNESYTRVAQKVAFQYHDKPQTALDTAIYWVEYVLRHKGAAHMRCKGLDFNFVQYYGLDVLAFLGVMVLLILNSLFRVVRLLQQLITFNDKKVKKQ